MAFLFAVLALAAVVIAFTVIKRLYRSPRRPRWMDSEDIAMAICVAFTGGLAGAIGAVVATAFALPFQFWGEATLAVAIVVGVIVVTRIGMRLVTGQGTAKPV